MKLSETYLFNLIEKDLPYNSKLNSNYEMFLRKKLEGQFDVCFNLIEEVLFEEDISDDISLRIWNYMRCISEFMGNRDGESTARVFVKAISEKHSSTEFDNYDLLVDAEFLTSRISGRISSMSSGCSGVLDFQSTLCSIYYKFENNQIVFPGDRVKSFIKVKFEQSLRGRLSKGDSVILKDGGRISGKGRILEVLNMNLLKS